MPRRVLPILVALLSLAAGGASDGVRTFDEDRENAVPSGFVFSGTVAARSDRWVVRRDRDTNVLVHTADLGRPRGMAIALLAGPSRTNLAVSGRFKLIAGAGPSGFVWRYRDPQNYYMVRLDLVDQEVGLYRVVSNNRIRIAQAEDLELRPRDWHLLKVAQLADIIRVYLDGVKVFEVHDRTFRDAGAVGLWSSADAFMHFDDLTLEGERR